MLLDVVRFVRNDVHGKLRVALFVLAVLFSAPREGASSSSGQPASPAVALQTTPVPTPAQQAVGASGATQTATPPAAGVNIVVLDPPHGGKVLGARGTGGIPQGEHVQGFSADVRAAT